VRGDPRGALEKCHQRGVQPRRRVPGDGIEGHDGAVVGGGERQLRGDT
jgi:hypothetical protein